MDLHDLTAGYALDALEPDERSSYEQHLATCEACRTELAGFWQATGALGRAAGGPTPPASLRARILDQARSERPNVVPLRRRWTVPVLASAASVAAVAAVAFGLWAASTSADLDDAQRRLAILGDPKAQTFASGEGEATLVVGADRRAALVVRELAPAPAGKDYEIWVFVNGVPQRAGLFQEPGVALLSRRVEAGQTVAVTLEADGGVEAPTGAPLFTASA